MNFINGFFKAISHCFKGFGLIFNKGLWPYMLYPVILWILMLVASIYLFAELATTIANYFNAQLNFENIPDEGSWLSFAKPFLTGYFTVIFGLILKLVFWFISGTFSKYVILIFLSPLFALLSESAEEKLKGNTFPFSFNQLIKDIFRGIGISLRNMFFEYSIIIGCFIITLCLPPLVFVTAPFLLFVSWYFVGFTMLDYNFERHKMGIRQSTKFVRKNMGLACGIGAVYTCLMWLPIFVGLMFGPVIAVIGATTAYLEIKEKETDINSIN